MDEEIKKTVPVDTDTASTIVKGNTFTGVTWDGQAIEAINNVAWALRNITEVFKSQNISFTLLQVNPEIKVGEKE
jgi:hypothetical protein